MEVDLNSNISINVNGIDIEWNLKKGGLSFLGTPSTLFWNDPSLLNIFKPLVDEIGKEMFCLQVAYSSSLGTGKEYEAIVTQLGNTFEEGFLNWSKAAASAGWGVFDIKYIDVQAGNAKVIVYNPWELVMQETLDESQKWGCPSIQGKIIGIFSHALKNTCWADANYFFDKETKRVEFDIYLQEATISDEIEILRNKIENDNISKLKKHVKEQKLLFENTFELAAVGIAHVSTSANWMRVNKKFCAILGYAKEELINLAVHEITHPDDRKTDLVYLEKILNKEIDNISIEKRYIRKDKTTIWVKLHASVVFKDNMQPDYFITVIEDITEKKKQELLIIKQKNEITEVRDRLSLAIEGSNNGLWDWNIITNEVYFSNKWKSMLGYAKDETTIDIDEWLKRLHPDDLSKAMQDAQDHLDGKTNIYENEHRILSKGGHYIWISSTGKALFDKDGKATRLLGFYADITDKKKIEENLIIEKNNAQKASQAKSEFLANMSHEIRTPLNAMVGFIDIVRKNETDKQNSEHLNIVKNSSDSLLRIINDILDVSKIERGDLELEEVAFDLKQLIKEMGLLFYEKTKEKNIDIKFHIDADIPNLIMSDSVRFKQVASNLIGNAIKFTAENGTVRINAQYNKNQTSLFFEVEDSGIGIDTKNIKKIFKPFSQEDTSTTRKFGGTGLGLTISSQIVKLMGGELNVSSKLGVGSKFYFNIPLSISKASTILDEEENLESKNFDFNGIKALLVEDNKTNQIFMEAIFEMMNITFDIANDGLESINIFKQNKYDVILMDENMPNMNGIEATKKILQYEKENSLVHTPIIALTANALKGDRERFLEAGMDEYISKPLDTNKLAEVLNTILVS